MLLFTPSCAFFHIALNLGLLQTYMYISARIIGKADSLMVISRLYKESRLTNKEMKASSALPVGLQIRREVIPHRPTQGWTVREYILRCKSKQASSTVQPWVGRWRRESSPSRRQTKSAPGAFSPNALTGICWTKMLISSAEAVKMPGKVCQHAF